MELPIFEPHDFNNDPLLPFAFHLDRIGGSKLGCIPNWHQSLEILYFIEGEGQVICNSLATDVRAGDVFVINAYQIHQVMTRTPAVSYYCLLVGSTFGKENAIELDSCLLRSLVADPAAAAAYRQIVAAYQDAGRFRIAGIRNAVLSLLVYLAARNVVDNPAEYPGARSRSLVSVMAAINYIRTHFTGKITIDDIAREVRLSRYHLSRIFRETTQYSIVSFISLLRCQHAQILLATTQHSVAEIAFLCGYRNLSHFTRTYKALMGVLPSASRKAAETGLKA